MKTKILLFAVLTILVIAIPNAHANTGYSRPMQATTASPILTLLQGAGYDASQIVTTEFNPFLLLDCYPIDPITQKILSTTSVPCETLADNTLYGNPYPLDGIPDILCPRPTVGAIWSEDCGFPTEPSEETTATGAWGSSAASSPAVVSGSGPVIPGSFGTDVDTSSNSLFPTFHTAEFNPSIAVNPTDPTNVIQAQFDIAGPAAPSTPPLAFGTAQCSVGRSTNGGTSYSSPRTFLPTLKTGTVISMCTRALVAFAGNTAYILYTDYEFGATAAASSTRFDMVMSTNGGSTWTNLAGAVPTGANTLVRSFPLTVELPLFPSLAVLGSNIDIVYSTFTTPFIAGLSDIRSISSNDAGSTFSNPVVVFSVPALTGLQLGPSNAYFSGSTVQILWMDTFSSFFAGSFGVRFARSTDNGVTWTNGLGTTEPETSPLVRFGSFLFFSYFPHLVSDSANARNYGMWTDGPTTPKPAMYRISYVVLSSNVATTAGPGLVDDHFENPAVNPVADQFYPALAVETDDGVLHATWADRRGQLAQGLPGFNFQLLYSSLTLANQAAAAWSSPLLVSDGHAGSAAGFTRTTSFVGTFYSLAATAASATSPAVHPAWTERRTNAPGPVVPANSLFADDTFTDTGAKLPIPVGGTVLSIDTLTLLAPYLAVAVFATLGLAYVLRRRFRGISLPQIPTINH